MADIIKISKFLSQVLRHRPERIGLKVDDQGWASVDELLSLMNANRPYMTLAILKEVVEKNDKQRFSFNEDGTMIRANQGHSIQIDLHLTPIAPPMFLFHGTAIRFLTSILEEGLTKQSRNHVHLSSDVETARKVGSRHGAPVILKVHSGAMADNGFVFFRSENGVWLTDYVPPSFLEVR